MLSTIVHERKVIGPPSDQIAPARLASDTLSEWFLAITQPVSSAEPMPVVKAKAPDWLVSATLSAIVQPNIFSTVVDAIAPAPTPNVPCYHSRAHKPECCCRD